MSLFPFAFMTASGRSQSLNAERIINLYPEATALGSKSQMILRSVPGNVSISTPGVGPIRGFHQMSINNVETTFIVSGSDLYEMDSLFVLTLRGAAGTIAGTGDVSMASNANNELVITNAVGAGWIWDGSILQPWSSVLSDIVLTAATVSFTAPDIMDDSGNGLGIFTAGRKVRVSGSVSNDGDLTLDTVAVGQITFIEQVIVTEAAGASITITELETDFEDDATNVTFLDQYIIYGRKGTGQVFATDVNNAKSINPLSFGTAESAPDNVIEVFANGGHLWVLGEKTTEVFFNTASSPFAFSRIGGAVMQDVGCIKGTVASVEQSVIWLAQDGTVYKAAGIQPKRISTHAVEFRLEGRTGFRAWSYKQEGHAFYVLGSDQGAEVFDITTGFWHERLTSGSNRYRANSYVSAFGKHLVGDFHLGVIYEMSLSNFVDGSASLQRIAISAPIEDQGKLVPISKLELMFEMGVGLTSGQGSDPQVILEISKNGGKTYGNQKWAGIGKKAEFLKRAIWNRLGSSRSRNLKITYSEPTAYTIYGGTLK